MIYVIVGLVFAIFAVAALRIRGAVLRHDWNDRQNEIKNADAQRAPLSKEPAFRPAPRTASLETNATSALYPNRRRNTADSGNAIVLYRKPRRGIQAELDGTSWFGGLPRLGDTEWPLDERNRPLHHVASISLDEITELIQIPGLPPTGILSCFIGLAAGDYEGTIVYVPEPSSVDTPLPDALPPLYEDTETPSDGRFLITLDRARTFNRWPMNLRHIDFGEEVPDLYKHSEIRDLLEELGPPKKSSNLKKNDEGKTWYWDTAQRFAVSLVASSVLLKERAEQAMAVYENAEPAEIESFHSFASEVEKWAFANDRYALMSTGDVSSYTQFFDQVSGNGLFSPVVGRFAEFYRVSYDAYGSNSTPFDETQRWMTSGPDAVFELLPTEAQTAADENYKLAGYDSWHQMFGPGQDMQGAAEENSHRIMLLQLATDYTMGLDFAGGHMQFWIDLEDLKHGRWENAFSTFEC